MSASTEVTHNEKGIPLFQPGFTMGIADMRRYPNERAFVLYRFKGEKSWDFVKRTLGVIGSLFIH